MPRRSRSVILRVAGRGPCHLWILLLQMLPDFDLAGGSKLFDPFFWAGAGGRPVEGTEGLCMRPCLPFIISHSSMPQCPKVRLQQWKLSRFQGQTQAHHSVKAAKIAMVVCQFPN